MPIVSAGVMCRARRSTKTQSVGWQSRRRKLCRRLCFNDYASIVPMIETTCRLTLKTKSDISRTVTSVTCSIGHFVLREAPEAFVAAILSLTRP